MGGREHGESLVESCTNMIIHDMGDQRLDPRGAVPGDPRLWGGGEGGDSYTMETGLVHRVYLVGIGNSIRVRSYGGEGRREREQRKRRGRGRDSSEEGLTKREKERERIHFKTA